MSQSFGQNTMSYGHNMASSGHKLFFVTESMGQAPLWGPQHLTKRRSGNTLMSVPCTTGKLRVLTCNVSHIEHKSTDAMNQTHNVFNSSTVWAAIPVQFESSPCCKSRWCVSCWVFLYGESPSKITLKVRPAVNVVLRPSQLQNCSAHWLKFSAADVLLVPIPTLDWAMLWRYYVYTLANIGGRSPS